MRGSRFCVLNCLWARQGESWRAHRGAGEGLSGNSRGALPLYSPQQVMGHDDIQSVAVHIQTSRDIALLVPPMQVAARELFRLLRDAGTAGVCVCTYRDPWEQARLYRQSRPRAEIVAKQASLDARGYPFLAQIIDQVGPQSGPHVTDAAPGESWHQFGEALDWCPLIDSKTLAWDVPEGDTRHARAMELWDAYRACATQARLYTLSWEAPHVQLRAAGSGNPLDVLRKEQVGAWADRMGWR